MAVVTHQEQKHSTVSHMHEKKNLDFCLVVPLAMIKCQLYLVSEPSCCRALRDAAMHSLYFVFQILPSDLEFQVVNPGYVAYTMNVNFINFFFS